MIFSSFHSFFQFVLFSRHRQCYRKKMMNSLFVCIVYILLETFLPSLLTDNSAQQQQPKNVACDCVLISIHIYLRAHCSMHLTTNVIAVLSVTILISIDVMFLFLSHRTHPFSFFSFQFERM